MKKFGLAVLGIVAGIVLIANIGPMIGLAISLVILYFSFKEFMKTESTGAKVFWAVVGLIALSMTAASAPAILGVAAIYILYIVYKKWNQTKEKVVREEADPFTSFEKEWAKLKQNH
ncbi:lmo0954 family membrane protein [Bacillus sp. 2205SS5-2]|uniref:lmo0954 family membrane protein n=1 Tax=Bacillus sp. 2205SS5-2 TaxID=3109031 RepID=UPI0030059071